VGFSPTSLADAEGRYGPGVSDTEIRIGQTMPYSGPLSAYGAIGRAQLAYFAMLNAEGGINGRRITLISLDDGYNYAKTLEQVRRLVEHDRVLLVFSLVGFSPNMAVRHYLNAHRVPQLFVADGHSTWADPDHFPWTMGWMPPNRMKASLFAQHILKSRPNARIALLYADDDYGHDYVQGFREGLGGQAARMIVGEQKVDQTDPALDPQIHALVASGADTLFSALAGRHAAQAIRKIAEIGWRPLHYVGVPRAAMNATLQHAGLNHAVGLISAHYAKDIDFSRYDGDFAVKAYAAWAKAYYAGDAYDGIATYGYQTAQALEYVLRRCGDDLSRENVMRVVTSMRHVEFPLLLPGVRVNTSASDYRPIEQLQLMRFNGKNWEDIDGIAGF
jgi:ABC-type branched-subunit amino acid transport system substrate-binding protein